MSVASATPEPAGVLSARNLTVQFGGLRALDGVSFDVVEGSILGIIGPNGAGKTTLFDVLSGLTTPESGSVWLDGADITSLSAHRRAARGLGRSFQDGRLFPSLTVEECITMALYRHHPVTGPVSMAFGGPLARSATRKALARAQEVIALMGLGDYVDHYVRDLSTGTRRLVDLACSVAHDPRTLLLDEPSSGIAQREVEQLGPLLDRVREETGCTMLLIEHDIPLVVGLSDELLVLETGRVLRRGEPRKVVQDPEVIRAYLGSDRSTAAGLGGTG